MPISGEAKAIVDERRLGGRKSDRPGVMASRVLDRRRDATGDTPRSCDGEFTCSLHLVRSSSSFCAHVASHVFFCSAISFRVEARSSAAFSSFCCSFCSSSMRSSSLLSKSCSASLALSSSSSSFFNLWFYIDVSQSYGTPSHGV